MKIKTFYSKRFHIRLKSVLNAIELIIFITENDVNSLRNSELYFNLEIKRKTILTRAVYYNQYFRNDRKNI